MVRWRRPVSSRDCYERLSWEPPPPAERRFGQGRVAVQDVSVEAVASARGERPVLRDARRRGDGAAWPERRGKVDGDQHAVRAREADQREGGRAGARRGAVDGQDPRHLGRVPAARPTLRRAERDAARAALREHQGHRPEGGEQAGGRVARAARHEGEAAHADRHSLRWTAAQGLADDRAAGQAQVRAARRADRRDGPQVTPLGVGLRRVVEGGARNAADDSLHGRGRRAVLAHRRCLQGNVRRRRLAVRAQGEVCIRLPPCARAHARRPGRGVWRREAARVHAEARARRGARGLVGRAGGAHAARHVVGLVPLALRRARHVEREPRRLVVRCLVAVAAGGVRQDPRLAKGGGGVLGDAGQAGGGDERRGRGGLRVQARAPLRAAGDRDEQGVDAVQVGREE
mmetsp:Transcript_17455/g.39988  ORF Transcript_17455/g.39988 Transcript_17455/m.39988 type:complete len:402 (-) Transcript_17455:1097-2302(-)